MALLLRKRLPTPGLEQRDVAIVRSAENSGVASPKCWEVPNILTLSQHKQYFWFGTPPLGAQNDKICYKFGEHCRYTPPGYTYGRELRYFCIHALNSRHHGMTKGSIIIV